LEEHIIGQKTIEIERLKIENDQLRKQLEGKMAAAAPRRPS
jgi:hypothetical protein